jgi:hypothetical protein
MRPSVQRFERKEGGGLCEVMREEGGGGEGGEVRKVKGEGGVTCG